MRRFSDGLLPLTALLAGAATGAAGCGPPDACWEAHQEAACEQPVGAATITVPAGYDAASAVLLSGYNCLVADGSCALPPRIIIDALFGDPGEYGLHIEVSLPAGEGAGTYDLSAPSTPELIVGGQIKVGSAGGPEDWAQIARVSGTIVVEQSTRDAFRASFDMQLETADQQVFAITDGRFELRGCTVVNVAAGCVAGN